MALNPITGRNILPLREMSLVGCQASSGQTFYWKVVLVNEDADLIKGLFNGINRHFTDLCKELRRKVLIIRALSYYFCCLLEQMLIVGILIVTGLVIFTTLVTLGVIFMLRFRHNVNEVVSLRFGRLFEELVTEVIFFDHNEVGIAEEQFSTGQVKVIKEFEGQHMGIPFHRQLCIDGLMNVYKNLAGVAAKRTVNLYRQFNLGTDTQAKLKNRKWYVKAKGIHEIEAMHVQEAFDKIYPLIDDEDEILRYEAQIAIMSLQEERNLEFLEDVKLPLTEWQQLMIINKLNDLKAKDFHNVGNLLYSENVSVITLAIKICQDFNLIEHIPAIRLHLHNEEPSIQIAAARALASFFDIDSLFLIFEELEIAPDEVKEELILAAAQIGIDGYLMEVAKYVSHENFIVSNAAANALIASGENGFCELKNIIETGESNLEIQFLNTVA